MLPNKQGIRPCGVDPENSTTEKYWCLKNKSLDPRNGMYPHCKKCAVEKEKEAAKARAVTKKQVFEEAQLNLFKR